LAVIGPGWLTAVTPQGAPRLFEADDYVRLELARALNRNVRVVPVLVGGAALPAATELPEDLRGLILRQAVVLHDETWHQDVEGLVGSLRGEPAVPTTRSRRWLVAAGAVALVAVGAAAWWWGPGTGKAPGTGEGPGSGGQVGSASGLASCAPAEGAGWTAITLHNDPTGDVKGPGGSLVFTVKDARWRARGEKWQVTLTTSMKNTRPDAVSQQAYYYGPLVVAEQEFKATCFAPSVEVVASGLVGDALVGFEVTCKPVGYIALVVQGHRIRVSEAPEPGDC
jgi:hypothetical protein